MRYYQSTFLKIIEGENMGKEREENNGQSTSDADNTNNGDVSDDSKNPFNIDYDERGAGQHERKNEKKNRRN